MTPEFYDALYEKLQSQKNKYPLADNEARMLGMAAPVLKSEVQIKINVDCTPMKKKNWVKQLGL